MELESPQSTVLRKVGTVVLVVLVTGILILGFFLYKKVIKDNEFSPSGGTPIAETPADTFDFPPLTDDERAALDASPANMFAQPAAVQKVATATETLAIGADCTVSPVIPKIKKGASLVLTNYDDIPHTITVNTHTSKKQSYLVSAHSSATMSVDFGGTGGSYSIYSMSCEKGPATIGMLMVTE
jgi:hypothetical protein